MFQQFSHASRYGLLILAVFYAVSSAAQEETCPDGNKADAVTRAGNKSHCLVVILSTPEKPALDNVLIVYLHGDNQGVAESARIGGMATNLANTVRVPTISLQRPGYRGALGTSDGEFPIRGDDYTADNVEIIFDALVNIKSASPGKRILLIGHSGGAAMTALMAARHATSADAYLLAACPCDIKPWREWRQQSTGGAGYWPNSLSPQAEANRIGPDAMIRLIIGSKDDNALPKFSEAYVATLKDRGVAATLTYADGASHSDLRERPEFFQLVKDMVSTLSAKSN